MGMRIVEKSSDQLVIKRSRQKWPLGVLGVAAGVVFLTISLATGWPPDPVMRGLYIFAGVCALLSGLYTLSISETFTADRQRQEVVKRTLYLGLWSHSSKVSFTQVGSVGLEHREGRTSPSGMRGPDVWTVHLLCSHFRQVKVCSGENEHEQLEIASALCEILNKELKRTKPGPGFFEHLLSSAQEEQDRRKPPSTWPRF